MPVHLGAMSADRASEYSPTIPIIQPGDVFVTNDPYRGGSHLPDVTVVTPVHRIAGTVRVPSAWPARAK